MKIKTISQLIVDYYKIGSKVELFTQKVEDRDFSLVKNNQYVNRKVIGKIVGVYSESISVKVKEKIHVVRIPS